MYWAVLWGIHLVVHLVFSGRVVEYSDSEDTQ